MEEQTADQTTTWAGSHCGASSSRIAAARRRLGPIVQNRHIAVPALTITSTEERPCPLALRPCTGDEMACGCTPGASIDAPGIGLIRSALLRIRRSTGCDQPGDH